MFKNLFIYITLIIVTAGCGSGPIGSTYHNVTAHYNAYFIAQERMKEIEQTIADKYQWNYNKILPIYIPIDSNDANALEDQIKDCIEKASIAIQRHEGSKWEDDSYVLVGKARFYSLEYADAIETFKYVNKHSEDDDSRHEALVELVRTFIDFQEINNAIAVSDYLKKEDLNNKNQKELNLVRAYLYQQREDLDQMVSNLVKAEALMSRGDERARIDFIVGQVYQKLGFESEAYKYYESCLSNGPEYELEFYTKLNMAQVTQLSASSDVKKIRKYFRKLLKDPKNVEYKDKIYYEMARFEFKQGNLELAIDHYKNSVRYSVNNQRQKAYSYLKLGEIYYDSLRNFELAKNYYDSTVITMPKDEENFETIKERQEILEDFVTQLLIVRKNDSLIHMSTLPIDSLTALATQIAKEKESKRQEKEKREARLAANREANAAVSATGGGGSLIGTGEVTGATWYFYNSSAVARGISEFRRIWGDRDLEDNWRRATKAGSAGEVASAKSEGVEEEEIMNPDEQKAAAIQLAVDEMLAQIPDSPEKVQALLTEVETALYNLGNIYNFKLLEKQNAIEDFESLISRFPETQYKAEVLYQLYLLYKDNNKELAEERANQLKENFPDSIYAKLIDNPNYREESQAATEQLIKAYTRAYRLYDGEKYKLSTRLLDSALNVYPENVYSDNLQLLKVLNIGKLEGQYKYQYELNNFLKNYPNSDLYAYAETLLKSSEDYQINLYNSARARFVTHFNTKHFLVIVYPNKKELSSSISADVQSFLEGTDLKLTTGSLILDENNAMILINEFPGRGSGEQFLKTLNTEIDFKEKHKGEKIYSFIITEDNFDIFYKTKDLNAYLNFFEKHYMK